MRKIFYFFTAAALLALQACKDDNIKLPDIAINFSTSELGIDQNKASEDVSINLSRVSEVPLNVLIHLKGTDASYTTDFITQPAAVAGTITILIPAGQTLASFKVTKTEGAFFEGTEKIKFAIASFSGPTTGVVIGEAKEMNLSFGSIVSTGSQMTLEGKSGAVVYANAVYVDFSSNTQVSRDRKSWELGFYCGDNDFRVVLNPAYAVVATASAKIDINALTIADANAALDLAATPMSEEGLSITAIDSYDGALTGTAFAAVSAVESENKIYFVASESTKASRDQWYKVRVVRKGAGYSVQYGKVGETTLRTIDISKNKDYNFIFLSLENHNAINVEPEAKKWDILWSYGVAATMGRPYFMQDLVMSNTIGGVATAQVMTAAKTYNDFRKSDITDLTFSNARNVIANNWRTTAQMSGSTAPLGIQSDRFYVVKDPHGNYYKLRFLKMGINNDGGERGRPQIEYQLLN